MFNESHVIVMEMFLMPNFAKESSIMMPAAMMAWAPTKTKIFLPHQDIFLFRTKFKSKSAGSDV